MQLSIEILGYELLAFFMQIATAKAETIIRKMLQHTYSQPPTLYLAT